MVVIKIYINLPKTPIHTIIVSFEGDTLKIVSLILDMLSIRSDSYVFHSNQQQPQILLFNFVLLFFVIVYTCQRVFFRCVCVCAKVNHLESLFFDLYVNICDVSVCWDDVE